MIRLRRPRKKTQEKLDLIKRLYESSTPIEEIAKLTSLSYRGVLNYIYALKNDCSSPKEYQYLLKNQRESLRGLYSLSEDELKKEFSLYLLYFLDYTNMTQRELARRVGLSEVQVKNYLSAKCFPQLRNLTRILEYVITHLNGELDSFYRFVYTRNGGRAMPFINLDSNL